MPTPDENLPHPTPLSHRQIARVLSAMLGGVAQQSMAEAERFAKYLVDRGLPGLPLGDQDIPSWRTAFIATIGGLYTWCDPVEIETAVLWLRANIWEILAGLRTMFPPPRAPAGTA